MLSHDPIVTAILGPTTYREMYRGLWDKINGAGSWALNPWVWVESFKRL